MKNNKLDLIKDVTIKNSLIKCVEDINKDNVFNFEPIEKEKNHKNYDLDLSSKDGKVSSNKSLPIYCNLSNYFYFYEVQYVQRWKILHHAERCRMRSQ